MGELIFTLPKFTVIIFRNGEINSFQQFQSKNNLRMFWRKEASWIEIGMNFAISYFINALVAHLSSCCRNRSLIHFITFNIRSITQAMRGIEIQAIILHSGFLSNFGLLISGIESLNSRNQFQKEK